MRRLVIPLIAIVFVAICFTVSLHAGRNANRANAGGPQPNSPTVLDPDDDNVVTELTYHWQNPRYYRDEQHQIGAIAVFLCVVAAVGAARRTLRQRRYRYLASGGAA